MRSAMYFRQAAAAASANTQRMKYKMSDNDDSSPDNCRPGPQFASRRDKMKDWDQLQRSVTVSSSTKYLSVRHSQRRRSILLAARQ